MTITVLSVSLICYCTWLFLVSAGFAYVFLLKTKLLWIAGLNLYWDGIWVYFIVCMCLILRAHIYISSWINMFDSISEYFYLLWIIWIYYIWSTHELIKSKFIWNNVEEWTCAQTNNILPVFLVIFKLCRFICIICTSNLIFFIF